MFQSSPTLHQRGRVIGSDSIVDGFNVSILARASSARVPDLESKLSDIAAGFQSAPGLRQSGRGPSGSLYLPLSRFDLRTRCLGARGCFRDIHGILWHVVD